MSMERNHDWKGPVALVLAGLALFIALGGRNAFDFSPGPGNVTVYLEPHPVEAFPQMHQTFPVMPTVVPAMPAMPDSRLFDQRGFGVVTYDGQAGPMWGGWHRWFGGMPPILPIFLALALVFFGWRLLSQNRHRHGPMQQAPAPPPYSNPGPGPGPGAPPPPGPPYYGDINQRQSDS
jgi:hypothetical protein